LTVTSLYIYEVLSYFREYNTYSTRNSDFNEYDTRKKDDFHVSFCNTSFFKKSVKNMGVKLFNRMPGEITQIEGFKAFRHTLKLFLLNHSFYSLQELLMCRISSVFFGMLDLCCDFL
jgi:hypothetical protein